MSQIHIYPDADALAQAAAEKIAALAAEAVAQRGHFSLVLSGGSTPRKLYSLLATDAYRTRIEWKNTHLFWGDERTVPPDHADSNYRMAKETLLDHAPLLPENIHRIAGELEPVQAAQAYEQVLKTYFGEKTAPRFDTILLGMGDDGHVASLYPHSRALAESSRWVAENYVERTNTWRITLTTAVLNAATAILILVSGENKAKIVYEVLRGEFHPHKFPAQMVKPVAGQLVWLLDADAAARLK